MNQQITTWLKHGLALHQSGRLQEALEEYERILKIDPLHFDALQLSGAIAAQSKQWDLALDLFTKALLVNQNNPNIFYNKGVVLQELNRYEEALECYNTAIRLKSDYSQAYNNRGNIYKELEELESALNSFENAIEFMPNNAQAHNNKGYVLNLLNRSAEALESINVAIELDSNYAQAYNNKGIALRDLGHLDEALVNYARATELNPQYAEAYSNAGNALKDLRRFDESFNSYIKAITLKQDFAEAYYNLGSVLKDQYRYEDALTSYRKAIELKPNYAECFCNRGILNTELMHLHDAERDFATALKLKPDLPSAIWSKAVLDLLCGDLEQGFIGFEWRWRDKNCVSFKEKRDFIEPLWLGKESLLNKTILIYSEQGLGDTIQFCRYVPLVASLGAKVIFEVQKPLRSLLSNLNGVAKLICPGDSSPPFEYQCPLLSLPLAFKTHLDNIPNQIPYIRADDRKASYWRNKLGTKRRLRVGLVWSGGFRAQTPEIWSVNERRNIPVEHLTHLKDLDIDFFSLQKGEPAESQFKEALRFNWKGPQINNYADELVDFSDTAGLIENLDLVISVDTSTAHLAAAMGKPVWIMNRFDTCWRWLTNTDNSPWYPTVKLFRQKEAGNWTDVMNEVELALEELLALD